MNQRVVTILLVALVIASGASIIVYKMITVQAGIKPPPTAKVIVAARDLEIGALIRDTDLTTAGWTGALLDGMATGEEPLLGRGVVSPIYKGEPVTESRLAAEGAGAGLAATIRPGMRACAVKVNDVVGVAGFVVSGMRVDVLITGDPPGLSNAGGPRVKTILQNIEVLSAGQNYQKDAEGKPAQVPVVNLLVTPEEAEILSLASNEMRIQLVLRNPLDTDVAETPGMVMAKLFGEPEQPPAQKAAPRPKPVVKAPPVPPPHLIEVINGPKRSEAAFAQGTPEKP
ncbi:MAG: Flp pilus assembly protein CpaB [Bryobacteraceae bacterium]